VQTGKESDAKGSTRAFQVRAERRVILQFCVLLLLCFGSNGKRIGHKVLTLPFLDVA
jgi:hypothetical protein